jgi:DNA helicase-2/ATP-dependent DNA helicase PcrA
MHSVLQAAHNNFRLTNKLQSVDKIIKQFEDLLKNQHLSQPDIDFYTKKGCDALRLFFTQKESTFTPTQQTELDFSNQQVIIDDAHLTGKLDLVDIDNQQKSMVVTDYKTGKPLHSWKGLTDFEKIKLHKYKQQLLFYKLLIENSRDYHNYKVERGIMQFVEPDKSNQIIDLGMDFTNEDITNFTKLINSVWTHIVTLNFPDTSKYSQNYKGLLDFEQDLIDNVV